MKVLLIDVNSKNSSTGKIVRSLYDQLLKEGHEAAICFGRGEKEKNDTIFKFGIDMETYIHAFMARALGLNGMFSFFSTLRLIRYIKRYKPDIIHIHELHSYFVDYFILMRFLKKNKIPIIWTFHCEYMYTGKCGYAYECLGWKTGCGNCTKLKEYPKSELMDFTKYMFKRKEKLLKNLEFKIITPSKWLMKRVSQSFLREKSCCVIHNGIDTVNIFYPRKSFTISVEIESKLYNKKIILSVAPNIMEERKGGKCILELSKKFDNSYCFVLIGTDNTRWFSDNVLFIKRTKNQHELAQWYSRADLFLICSMMENFPTTCVEALCCGTPIVGFDVGGTAETAPNFMGEFVEYGNLELLEKKVKSMLLRKNNTDEIAQVASHLYSESTMFKYYYNEYQKLLNK